MKKIALKVQQTLERALFGATAEEAVAMRLKLIDTHVEQALERRVARLIDTLEQDEDADGEPDGETPEDGE